MAETEKGKKVVYVHPYQRDDGTRVPAHERSTPSTRAIRLGSVARRAPTGSLLLSRSVGDNEPTPADAYGLPVYVRAKVHCDRHIEVAKPLYLILASSPTHMSTSALTTGWPGCSPEGSLVSRPD